MTLHQLHQLEQAAQPALGTSLRRSNPRAMRYHGTMKGRLFWVGLLFAGNALGALTATVTSVSQTQAVLQEQGFSGSCSVLLSTSPALTPLHPDVDGTEYSGSGTDSSRPDTLVSGDGSTRTVTLGHLNDDRALAAYSTYYYQVSGCGGTVTGSFTTANLSSGTTRTEQSPFNSAKWGNLGLPTFDWTTKRQYVDPMTGVTLVPMTTSIQTWRTGCGASGCASGSRPFTDWAGGSGWTNPSTLLSGSATTATTSNTNPMDLYVDLSGFPDPIPYDLNVILADLGVVVWGKATSSATADRVIDLCIFLNPAVGCASNTIQLVLPTGSVQHVLSGSSDPDGAFPASFPSSPFFGWTDSTSPLIRMENRETFGSLAVSGNNLTIVNSSLGPTQHFSSALNAGQKIFVSGSSCVNHLCTLAAAPTGPGAATTVEQPGVANATFRAYGWGIRVWKDDPDGSATIGLNLKLAGSAGLLGVQAGGDKCSQVQVTSGDGKQGYLCALTNVIYSVYWLAFIANDGTTRILSSRSIPISFDDVQGNVFYAGAKNANGGWTIYKYTYTGDYTAELNYNYTCNSSLACPALNDFVSAPVDLMPHASGADLDQQIEANQGAGLPAYNSAIYGHWTAANGAVSYYGSSGHFGFFCNVYSGQGQANAGGPGWCSVVDLSQNPARVVRLIHTLDGTGAPNARFGSLHTAQQVDGNANTLFIGLDELDANNTSTVHGGPFQAQVQSILMADGVTWNSNTCLDWPAGAGTSCASQNYYQACPANSAPYTQCVTFRLPQNGVCNVAATAIERATWPCPWNASYSQFPLMQVGDNAADLGAPGGYDSEHFRILSLTPDAGNTLRVVAARNSVYDYCSFSPWQGQVDPLSAQNPTQLRHVNGWQLAMMPGTVNTCGFGVLLQEQTSGVVEELGHSFSGHSAPGAAANGLNFVTTSYAIFNQPFSGLGAIPPSLTTSGASFHGTASNIGGQLQSYTDDSQLSGALGYPWALDTDPLVACGAEQLGCGTGRTLTAMGGTVYKIQPIGSAAPSNATYKTQPMIGWAGRYQLQDVSGPSSILDSTPYSMCFALNAGECHAGSSANDVFVNVPVAYDPGYCSASLSWLNVPCVLFGDNAPAGGIRQFGIFANDLTGSTSRFVSNGWSSVGRQYPYTHSTVFRNGQWVMQMGTNIMDGFSMTGLMISIPPWVSSSDSDNDFKGMKARVPNGLRYAEIEFGYSRYIGPGNSPSNGLFCTSRADSCETATALAGTGGTAPPFAFKSETSTPVPCTSGCSISIPAVGPNILYYRLRRSSDGQQWVTSDIQAVAIP